MASGMFDSKPGTNLVTGAAPGVRPTRLNKGERRFVLYIEDMYDPDIHPVSEKENYVVPFENQAILDVVNGMWYRCIHVDEEGTLKATLVPLVFQNPVDVNVVEQDWIFGMKGGPFIGEALLSVDFSVRPNIARVDSTIMRPGAAYALLYRGTTPDGKGKIISAVYKQNGDMDSNKIPTPLAEIVDRTNLEIKTTGQFSVTENEESLPNGAQAVLCFYDQGGNFIPPAQLVRTQHSSYMKDHRIGIKYLKEIRLLSPWFTNMNQPDTLRIPITTPMTQIEFRAEKVYSDGTTSGPHPVNGTMFSLNGLNEYRPSYPGQSSEIVLIAPLDPDEQFYEARPGNPNFERKTYTIVAGEVEGAYAPRIFTYPQYSDELKGYSLQHFLYDLDRKAWVNVTEQVTLNDKSPAWKPAAYGIAQAMIFNINLRDVAPTYKSEIFIQHTEIVLYRDMNTAGKRWDVSFVFDKPTYQAKFLKATNNGANSKANIGNGIDNQKAWLDTLYWGVYPSYSLFDEDKAPDPTHFYLRHPFDGRKWLFPLASWKDDLPMPISMAPGTTWYIDWVRRDSNGNELQLATTGVTVTL